MEMSKLNDSQLIASYLAGDGGAISTLIERHKRRVTEYIAMMVKDRDIADDIFQETILKAVGVIDRGRYCDNGKFLSWVLRIAHNQVIDHFRHARGEQKISESDAGFDILGSLRFSDETVEDRLVHDQIHEDLRRIIERLPDEQRDVVMMRYFNDMSFKEIAEESGVSINTALGRMRYALINLRKLIHEHQMILTA
ncbi:MAG: sigma-70 family RNA polymerase sigma factor [Alistipes sp.]|jgi:RNA polymerase sigma-70 factor (ECF subfamily)|nr:sigma-70 family RNA polymerase sigma factor [Alistipes sp.]